jgi:DNA-binding transcriptional LysR family regulator
MTLRRLRYFVAVAEELNFRRAAERLHLAQPALSEQIRKLEAEVGVRLLTRTHRGVTLTDAGAALLEQARHVLRQADVAQRVARQAHERSIGCLRVGYLPDALPRAVPQALRAFTASAPGIRVMLQSGATRSLIEDVREDRLDVAVICLPAPAAGLRLVPLGVEGTVAALPDSHPHANDERISLQTLEGTPFVHLSRAVNPAYHDSVISACSASGIAPPLVEIGEPGLEQVLLAVASGAGVALLPESAAKRYCTPGVRFRPLAPPAPSCEVAIVARAEADTTTTAFLRLASRRHAGHRDRLVTAARQGAATPSENRR